MSNSLFRKSMVIGIIGLLVCLGIFLPSGKIDVSASGNPMNEGNLSGYVNNTDGYPIEGALVRVHFHETYEEDYSDENGFYHVTNIPICWCMKNATCSKDCYITEWVLLAINEDTTYDFVLTDSNCPPTPPIIKGETRGKPGEEYDYEFMSIDPDGDDIAEYVINWGDASPDEIITGPFASGDKVDGSHTWTRCGDYIITARAKDINGLFGPWSSMEIPITRTRQISNLLFMRLLERFTRIYREYNPEIIKQIKKIG